MNKDIRREGIFNLYSNNLLNVCNSPGLIITNNNVEERITFSHPVYICPICLGIFTLQALNQESKNSLSLEDVPPKSVGGKPILLTCKICNNTAGYEIDNHLKLESDIINFSKGEYISAKIKKENNRPFKGKVLIDENTKKIFLIFPHNHQYARQEIEELFNNWDGGKFSFQISGPNKKKLNVALLRIAYLKAFEKFGYSYIFSEGGAIIREQIKKPFEKIINPIKLQTLNNIEEGLYFISSPPELKSILIVFTLKFSSVNKTYGIILPGPYKKHIESYIKFKSGKILFDPVVDYDFLEDGQSFFQLFN